MYGTPTPRVSGDLGKDRQHRDPGPVVSGPQWSTRRPVALIRGERQREQQKGVEVVASLSGPCMNTPVSRVHTEDTSNDSDQATSSSDSLSVILLVVVPGTADELI
ncbi:hypothetical protein NDU88_005252 [Pleurodeles waltl]|uniref:Uncharacterized protein n=1 Tax=Pleurodeles waltl TaxID=8319 RepID=A0AAV7NPQ6_PLEWA|nr:hypothetical protein NDU88_005252 [Pleurodeles waltl]